MEFYTHDPLTEPQTVTPVGPQVAANVPWQTPTAVDPEVRHKFAVNTCSGCHRDETGIGFLQVGFPAESRDRNVAEEGLGAPAALATFLVGGDPVPDPVDGSILREFNDLQRRQVDFEELLDRGPRRFRLLNRKH